VKVRGSILVKVFISIFVKVFGRIVVMVFGSNFVMRCITSCLATPLWGAAVPIVEPATAMAAAATPIAILRII
jgi:hypothetical protein